MGVNLAPQDTLALVLDRIPGLEEFTKRLQSQVKLVPFMGIASTEAVDMDGESIKQENLDWSYFLKAGRIIDNHGRSGSDVVGFPSKVWEDKVEGKKVTWIEGYLFEDEHTQELIKRMRESQAVGRPFGLSIEATQPEYGSEKGVRTIKRASVINVAVTPYPVNPTTFVAVLKALKQKGIEFGNPSGAAASDGAALTPQSLDRKLAVATLGGDVMTDAIKKFLEGLDEEEKAGLKKALEDKEKEGIEETEDEKEEETEPVAPEEKEEEEGIGKGISDFAEATPGVVEIDATEFLNQLSQAIQQGFEDAKAFYESVQKQLGELRDIVTALSSTLGEAKALGTELKSMFEKNPAVLKGLSFGVPSQEDSKIRAVSISDPAVLKGLLMAKAADEKASNEQKLSAGWLAAKMETGYTPSAEELAKLGIVIR
jgi:hypothetical protein